MKNVKLLLIIFLVLIIAYFMGGFIMSMAWVIIKIIFGIIGLALIIGGFYLGRKWTKKKLI